MLRRMPAYLERHATSLITAALADTRVVVLNGARQSGKSTLVHHLIRGIPDARERRLDQPS